MTIRLVLVGCGAAKQDLDEGETVPAADLYTSSYAALKRGYAEAYGDRWGILSAEHGAIAPDERIGTYDTVIGDLDADEIEGWVDSVGATLEEWVAAELSDGAECVEIELLAGRAYIDPLRPVLSTWGDVGPVSIRFPFDETSGIGEQMGWLRERIDAGDGCGE